MLPRMVLRVRRAVRRLAPRPEELASTGQENQASWDRMLSRCGRVETDTERRLKAVERELNRLGLY
jgi:hypothetical protein